MDKAIERILMDNPTLDGAETITVTVTREDKTRHHYYIYKKNTNEGLWQTTIPLSILTRENGKGRNKHYIAVAVDEKGNHQVYDLNKPKEIEVIRDNKVVINNPDEIGCFTNKTNTLPF